ncbi:uncharacterized protein BYT42DRAFT_397791 [Radiomyces spectabilis]|uniref:uncharacterized protein n=1 Tax=Radiomyces spectabilis TaxID=64574 RepID=UPI002221127B|nr:uncharacterized protein BYT42DRAFT_397791 [Radiomyces spectabilis]KAI8374263.1 hypothetical protein BYT42DRAFT_397791 [Radiomyces spectabilis]
MPLVPARMFFSRHSGPIHHWPPFLLFWFFFFLSIYLFFYKMLLETVREIYKLSLSTPSLVHVWPLVTATVVSTLNRPNDIPQVYKFAEECIDETHTDATWRLEKKQMLVTRLQEALYKSYAIVGFPKVINSLSTLSQAVTGDVRLSLLRRNPRDVSSWEQVLQQRARGRALFDKIYECHATRVYDNLSDAYPDLAEAAINHIYAPILSDVSILGEKETSFVLVAALIAENLPKQLRGQWYGAQHNGATLDELRQIQTMVHLICKEYNVPCAEIAK